MYNKTIIGRAEWIVLGPLNSPRVPAKIDSGADICSVWASDIREANDTLQFRLFNQESPYYTSQEIQLTKPNYRSTVISNSFGVKERRYVVTLEVNVIGMNLHVDFTLANRSTKIYPVLLGRNLLEQDFLIDVTKGEPLIEAEKASIKEANA